MLKNLDEAAIRVPRRLPCNGAENGLPASCNLRVLTLQAFKVQTFHSPQSTVHSPLPTQSARQITLELISVLSGYRDK